MHSPAPDADSTAAEPMRPWHKRRLIALLALSVLLHFFYLWSIPPANSVESLNLRILRDLLDGHMRVGSLSWTCFSAFHPYPILFYLAAAPLYWLFRSLIAVRILTAASAVLTTALVFAVGRRMKDVRMGLWGAFFFTVAPLHVIFTRWGFAHSAAMMFVVAAFYYCVSHRQARCPRTAALAGLCAGLATVTVYWAAPVIILVFVLLVATSARDALRALLLALAPWALLLLVMILVHGYGAVAYDIASLPPLLGREIPGISRAAAGVFVGYGTLFGIEQPSVVTLWRQLRSFLFLGAYQLLGFIGMFLTLRGWRRRWLLGAFLLVSLPIVAVLGRRIGISYESALLFVPFLMIGLGALASAAFEKMEKLCRSLNRAPAFFMFLVTIPLVAFAVPGLVTDFRLLQRRLDTSVLLERESSVRSEKNLAKVAAFVNERVHPDDLVVTTPLVGHRIDCAVADARQLVAYSGKHSHRYPRDIPRDRFTTPLGLDDVTYLVTDFRFRLRTIEFLNVLSLVLEMEKARWPLVFQLGEYWVYAGPRAHHADEVIDEDPMIVGNDEAYATAAHARERKRDREGSLWAYRRAVRALEVRIEVFEQKGRITSYHYEALAAYYEAIAKLEEHFGSDEAARDARKRAAEANEKMTDLIEEDARAGP